MMRALAAAAVLSLTAVAQAQPGQPAPVDDAVRKEWMKEAEGLFKRYAEASGEQEARMRSILVREYNRRLVQLDERYSRRMSAADELKRKAGLPEDFWAPEVKLYRYAVEKWKE